MNAHDTSPGRYRGGILGWLGFGERGGAPDVAPLPLDAIEGDRRDSLRMRQLDEIAAFLRSHHLEMSAATLSTAWTYLTGADRDVVNAVDRRMQQNLPLTLQWCESELCAPDHKLELAQLTDLMQRLEASIDEFARTSRDAHSATSKYQTALAGHVNELEHVTRAGEVISDLANIAKAMLKRTREVEKQMLRSEAQTRALKRRLDEARRSAEEDHLTGLPNRRAFEARYDEQYREALAAVDTLSVAFCDIDHFKRINDEHGHEAGDRVLRLVAESLARLSADNCHVARHGGEEFVMLLRGVSATDAAARLDALREELSARRLVNRATDQPLGQVTFSAGVADVFAFADQRTALRAADAALYRAKASGRDRVEIATSNDATIPQLKVA